MLVTVQFDARSTIEYLGLLDDNSTLVSPRACSLLWAISAFSLVRSGMVICAAGAAADGEAPPGAEVDPDPGWVTVTVAGAAGL